ncbi:Protein of unknown function [Gryllus bimaculatus]|nr:Protein of unknown function [Gryllus bimaculatus]
MVFWHIYTLSLSSEIFLGSSSHKDERKNLKCFGRSRDPTVLCAEIQAFNFTQLPRISVISGYGTRKIHGDSECDVTIYGLTNQCVRETSPGKAGEELLTYIENAFSLLSLRFVLTENYEEISNLPILNAELQKTLDMACLRRVRACVRSRACAAASAPHTRRRRDVASASLASRPDPSRSVPARRVSWPRRVSAPAKPACGRPRVDTPTPTPTRRVSLPSPARLPGALPPCPFSPWPPLPPRTSSPLLLHQLQFPRVVIARFWPRPSLCLFLRSEAAGGSAVPARHGSARRGAVPVRPSTTSICCNYLPRDVESNNNCDSSNVHSRERDINNIDRWRVIIVDVVVDTDLVSFTSHSRLTLRILRKSSLLSPSSSSTLTKSASSELLTLATQSVSTKTLPPSQSWPKARILWAKPCPSSLTKSASLVSLAPAQKHGYLGQRRPHRCLRAVVVATAFADSIADALPPPRVVLPRQSSSLPLPPPPRPPPPVVARGLMRVATARGVAGTGRGAGRRREAEASLIRAAPACNLGRNR